MEITQTMTRARMMTRAECILFPASGGSPFPATMKRTFAGNGTKTKYQASAWITCGRSPLGRETSATLSKRQTALLRDAC